MVSAKTIIGAGVLAVTAGGALLAVSEVARERRTTTREDAHWRTVTVQKSPDEIAPGGRLPEPLADLGDAIEVRMTPAPGGRGTELSARLVAGDPVGKTPIRRALGTDPRQAVRIALRQAKTLVEVGELPRQHPQPEGRRRATLLGPLGEFVAGRSAGEGVL